MGQNGAYESAKRSLISPLGAVVNRRGTIVTILGGRSHSSAWKRLPVNSSYFPHGYSRTDGINDT